MSENGNSWIYRERSHYCGCDKTGKPVKADCCWINELQEQNKKLRECLEFYAKENNWIGVSDTDLIGKTKWIRIVEDDMEDGKELLGGKRARALLKELE